MNLWKELGKLVIKKGAPLLGGVIGGPAGAAIGGLVAKVFGGDPTDPAELMARVKADADAAGKLKQIEIENHTRLAEIDLENTESARSREIEITKVTGKLNWPMYLLAGVVVVGFFAIIAILIFVNIPVGSKDIMFMLLGVLAAQFGAVCNYFFGSSKGSADKNKMLAPKG